MLINYTLFFNVKSRVLVEAVHKNMKNSPKKLEKMRISNSERTLKTTKGYDGLVLKDS